MRGELSKGRVQKGDLTSNEGKGSRPKTNEVSVISIREKRVSVRRASIGKRSARSVRRKMGSVNVRQGSVEG